MSAGRPSHLPGGASKRPEYKAWISMKARCYNPNAAGYQWYGAQGVTVCPSWRGSFLEFLGDMERYPGFGHVLELIDENKNFEPGNVQWVKRQDRYPKGFTQQWAREYSCWCAMRGRCYDEKSKSYPYYGGRGIKVCDRWHSSFENFLADMGPRPTPQHSLERRDNDGDYDKENCFWATRDEQANNRRNNVTIEYEGELYRVKSLAERFGLSPSVLRGRLALGWPLHLALHMSVQRRRKKRKQPEG